MVNRCLIVVFALICSFGLFAIDLRDVDVFIGSVEPGHATPAAASPFGMVQAGPDTSPTERRFESGQVPEK